MKIVEHTCCNVRLTRDILGLRTLQLAG